MAMAYPDPEKFTFGLLLKTHAILTQLLAEKFPNTMILPAFGNNDSEFHDNPQPDATSKEFYSYMADLWFNQLPGNQNKLLTDQDTAIRDSFLEGGFYRVDLSDNLSLLTLNTLFYDSERSMYLDAGGRGIKQRGWLE